jgi:hypothetical protein
VCRRMAHGQGRLRVLDRACMDEAALLRLAGNGPSVYKGRDPFGGQKIRTKETLGGKRDGEGGDKGLLRVSALSARGGISAAVHRDSVFAAAAAAAAAPTWP